MDFLDTLKDTPIPSLLVVGGLFFLFVGVATIKKPIVIEITESSRRTAILLGLVLLVFGMVMNLLPKQVPVANLATRSVEVAATGSPTPAASMPDPQKYYLVRSALTQKVLTADGSAIVQSDWVNGSSQKWIFEPLKGVDDGYYEVHSALSGECWDVYDGEVENDAKIISYPCGNQANQKWRLVLSEAGTYYFEAKHSGKVMDVPNGQSASGIQVIQYSYHGDENQQWILTEVEP